MKLALACVALCACGAPRLRDAWHGTEDLSPGPGRVPLVVESTGAAQNVAITRTPGAFERGAPRWLCQTPCVLHVPRVRLGVATAGLDVRGSIVALTPGATGDRLRVRAPRESSFRVARTAATGGVLVAAVGALFLAVSPFEVRADSPDAPAVFVVGGALLLAGLAFAVPGAIALAHLGNGAASHTTLGSDPTAARAR